MNFTIAPLFIIDGIEIGTTNWSDDVVNQLIAEALTARVRTEQYKVERAERALYQAKDKFERVIQGMNHGLIEIHNKPTQHVILPE